ncbi:MAG: phage terminase large subunit family protein [Pseudobdellovibrionaceae bacterium]
MQLNDWAETHGHLSAESSADVGKWKSIPYQIGIMNLISDERIEGVVFKKSARVGYTKIITHAIGYYIEHRPSSILIVQPTIEDAEGFSKEELAPYIRDVKVLGNIVTDAKAKDGTNSILHKLFPGGVLSIIGANSPRGFRRISRKIILLDEVSGYPKSAGPEGSPVKLAIRRSEYFWDRKIIAGSTPTLMDECEISRMYEETDQRHYFVPCPHCEHPQYLKFQNLKWSDEDPSDAYFECEKNKCKIEHKHKRWMIEKAEEWERTRPGKGYGWVGTAESKNPKWVGVHIWAAYSYSPNSTWADIVKEFQEAKRGGPESIQTFVNTVMGDAYDENFSERHNIKDLQARTENYALGTAPAGVIFCTAGVDVQDNRLAISIFGWGHEDECWVINHQEIYGNPGEGAVWKSLDALLGAPIIHEKYKDLTIKAAAIDSGGHYTHEVYQYTRERRLKSYIAIKGASQKNKPAIGKPTAQDINYKGKSLKKGAQLYNVGVDTIKSTIYSRLKILEKGAKYIHFSFQLVDDYFKQLQSETKKAKLKGGKRVIEWIRKGRNEALDCFVYGFAAKEFVLSKYPKKLSYSMVEKELELKAPGDKVIVKPAPQRAKPSGGRGGFVKNW